MRMQIKNNIVPVAMALSLVLLTTACDDKQQAAVAAEGDSTMASASAAESAAVTKLQVEDKQVGTGRAAKSGNEVTVHYTGTLYPSGKKFDSSLDRGEPFQFSLGAGQVIRGWDEGVVGMKVGGKRTLIIPSDKAYGDMGHPPVIPQKATLKFDIELLDVQ